MTHKAEVHRAQVLSSAVPAGEDKIVYSGTEPDERVCNSVHEIHDCSSYNEVPVYASTTNGDTETKPFVSNIKLYGPQGEIVRVSAVIDNGAMVNVICRTLWDRVGHRLAQLEPSQTILRMANGMKVPSKGRWTGTVEWAGARVTGTFEMIDSGQNWTILFGLPLLRAFDAVQHYGSDVIVIRGPNGETQISNRKQPDEASVRALLQAGLCPVLKESGRSREVTFNLENTADAHPQVETWYVGPEGPPEEELPFMPQNPLDVVEKPEVFTRKTKPFAPKRVQAVLNAVAIGPDLEPNQRDTVTKLVVEFADCFALSMSEVLPVPEAVHKLNIPQNAKFSRKVYQKSFTPPQREYISQKIDEMLQADIIEQCAPDDIKCVSPITLGQRAHGDTALTLDELKHRVNEECIRHGIPPLHNPPPPPPLARDKTQKSKDPKWRICQNFTQLNKVTQIAPMPQGDLRAKQQRLSGYRWVSTFDFASGFYAVVMAEESRPYLSFYVEGRGYFRYKRMPFGLTGAPSAFANMTAKHLHDLTTPGTMELFVDDGGCADSDFDGKIKKLRAIFNRVRERQLSLSATKTKLFFSQAVFGGATVGRDGVTPDLAKLTSITDWPKPADALNLSSFLGIAGHFRDLVRNYARIEGPLRQLLKAALPPAGTGKAAYRRALQDYKLDDTKWQQVHSEAFLKLKHVLTSEPVLQRPRYDDGEPFIVTTDGCKDGFGAVLAQKSSIVQQNGAAVVKFHPIAFASKRTSRTEEKYSPFLLELAALKFALDRFSDTIWGFPIEIETDCSALRHVLTNDKLNDTHARWLDAIMAHQITEVRHVPGKLNVVADGISRAGEGREKREGDGSEWTVDPGWEATGEVINDIWQLETTLCNSLQDRFKQEPLFLEVIAAIQETEQEGIEDRVKRRAQHRAKQYFIEEGKLWRIRGGTAQRARPRLECVTSEEARQIAGKQHTEHGHWGRDAIKLALMDKIYCPGLDAIILDAIADCGHCKNFGPTALHALMDPLTRRHPFELLAGDYLSLPNGKGGFHTVGLYIDVFAQHLWAFPYKTAGSAKTTIDSLSRIWSQFPQHETFMTDGGSHFNCKDVNDYCANRGVARHIVAAYAPFVNGLIEGANRLLMHVLKRLGAPDLNETGEGDIDPESIPKSWPTHLPEAIRILNSRILTGLKFSPVELLFGLPVNTKPTPIDEAVKPITADIADIHMAYADQQRLDGYERVAHQARRRKAAFDKRVEGSKAGPVTFETGELVQVYRSDLDYTFKTERKLLPKWSTPRRVVGTTGNLYRLSTLSDKPIDGLFHARRLRSFQPGIGTRLALDEARRTAAKAKNVSPEDGDT